MLEYINYKSLKPYKTNLDQMMDDLEDMKIDFEKYAKKYGQFHPYLKDYLDEVPESMMKAFWAINTALGAIETMIEEVEDRFGT